MCIICGSPVADFSVTYDTGEQKTRDLNWIAERTEGSLNTVSEFVLYNPLPKWGANGTAGTAGGEVTWSFATATLTGTTNGTAYSSDAPITDSGFQQAVRQAFDAWAQVANISFREVTDASDVQIRFAMDTIDGASGTLAFADTMFSTIDNGVTFNTDSVQVIYDTAESWNNTSFLSTSIHEIGHALGIGHSEDPNAIMTAVVIGDNYGTSLAQDDINAVQAIYGAATTTPTTPTTPTTVDIPEVALGVYRFYNTSTGVHFYSASHPEATSISTNLPQYNYEGVAYKSVNSADANAVEFFRFYNTATQTHFYTASTEERDSIIATSSIYNYEGVAYHLHSTADSDDIALYRFFNTGTGTHFYTASEAERDNLTNAGSQFSYEGIVGYIDTA